MYLLFKLFNDFNVLDFTQLLKKKLFQNSIFKSSRFMQYDDDHMRETIE